MKKIISFTLASILFVFTFFQAQASTNYKQTITQPTGVTAKGIYMVELGKDFINTDDDTILISNNYTTQFYPASLTKIMTAIVVMDKYSANELSKKTQTMTPAIKKLMVKEVASTAKFVEGEDVLLIDLLYATLLPSGCDAAVMLAENVAGTETDFSSLMNEKAKQLGANSTNFVNATGLHDPKQYTTIADLELIAKYALFQMKNCQLFKQIVSTPKYILRATNKQQEREIKSSNYMLEGGQFYYKGITGIKTGNTTEAGQCLISLYEKDNFNILSIVMKSSADLKGDNVFTDTQKLYDWFKSTYSKTDIAQVSKPILTVPLKEGANGQKTIELTATQSLEKIVPTNAIARIEVVPVKELKSLTAPVTQGKTIIKAKLILDGYELGIIELTPVKSVSKNPIIYLLYGVFIILLILALILSVFIIKKIMKSRTTGKRRY